MDGRGSIIPCRIVPFNGSGEARVVGHPGAACIGGAWSPDGKWVYLSAETDGVHLWRERLSDGKLEQITLGPTTQEGIAMAPDGKSLVTSVGTEDVTIWMHDQNGDHQISSEGTAIDPSFSADGKSLYYLSASGQTHGFDLVARNLARGNEDKIVSGLPIARYASIATGRYSVSRDGKKAVFMMYDENGRSSVWIAPTDRRSSPVRLTTTGSEDSPYFLPDGDIVFRTVEGDSNFLYRMKPDGSDRKKVAPDRILDLFSVSPDGRWLIASTPDPNEEHTVVTKAFAADGGQVVIVCQSFCPITWNNSDTVAYINYSPLWDGTYALPVLRDTGLPKLPPGGIVRMEDVTNPKTNSKIPVIVNSGVSASVYTYSRKSVRRNLYRIPLQ